VLRNDGVSKCNSVFELTQICRTETHTIAYETPSPSDTDDGGQDIVEAAKTDDDGESSPSAKEDAVTEESIVKSESTTKTEQE